jgi:hypothetical protein
MSKFVGIPQHLTPNATVGTDNAVMEPVPNCSISF